MEQKNSYHDTLRSKMDEYAHFAYQATRSFPKEELYGITSQLRRSALSVILNYTEGFARGKEKSYLHFLDISYGSLKESKYLLHFSMVEGFLSEKEYKKGISLADEIGAMLWKTMQNIKA